MIHQSALPRSRVTVTARAYLLFLRQSSWLDISIGTTYNVLITSSCLNVGSYFMYGYTSVWDLSVAFSYYLRNGQFKTKVLRKKMVGCIYFVRVRLMQILPSENVRISRYRINKFSTKITRCCKIIYKYNSLKILYKTRFLGQEFETFVKYLRTFYTTT